MAETKYILSQTAGGQKEWIVLPTGDVSPHNQAWSTITDRPTTLAGYGITDGGESMTYPAGGIALSTGAAWGTSIINNSANWNTAYGWGNWASNFGTAAGKICQGNDSRLSDSRTPMSHNNTYHSETYITASALSPYAPLASPTFTGYIKTDHIGETTSTHDVVFDNAILANGAHSYSGGNYSLKIAQDMLMGDGYWIGMGDNTEGWVTYVAGAGVTGMLFNIDYYGAATQFLFRGKDAGGTLRSLISAKPRAGVELYYTGTKRFETTSAGAEVTGNLIVTGEVAAQIFKLGNFSLAIDGSDLVIKDGTTIIHRITAAVAGKSDILSSGGIGVNQSI